MGLTFRLEEIARIEALAVSKLARCFNEEWSRPLRSAPHGSLRKNSNIFYVSTNIFTRRKSNDRATGDIVADLDKWRAAVATSGSILR